MAYNRSHSRYMRRARFANLRHNRRALDFLDTQATRLASTATGKTVTFSAAVATFTGDGVALANNETVTVGAKVYTAKTALSFAAASGTLTSNNTNASDGDTVTIDTKVYTFQTSLTNVDGHIKIGADADATLTSLKQAVNASGGTPGTDYATANTIHATVSAGNVTAHAILFTAKTKGIAGNSIATTKVAVTYSWGAATLTGGVADVANEVLRASASATLTNLFHAINGTGGTAGTDYSLATVASTEVVATNPSGTTVLVTAINPGAVIATGATGTHGSWDVATLAGGSATLATSAAHGYADFDGPFVLTTSGTLPTGLALATEYFIHKVDANTWRYAKSIEALRLLDYISITTNGTGTHTQKRAANRQGIFELLRRNSAPAIVAATDIDNLNG